MKHFIDAKPDSELFRQEFNRIQEEFIGKLNAHVAEHTTVTFRACDIDGNTFAWVWNDAEFRNTHEVGTHQDAQGFIRNMIGQGMLFAFAGFTSGSGVVVWLCTWETPEEKPSWPGDQPPLFEEIHDGVFLIESEA